MNDLNAFFSGFALSAALIIAIGAQNAFVLRQGLRREHVGPIVAFCALADITLMAAGVAGLGAALDRLPGLSAALTLSGALFLGWYGISGLRLAARSAHGLETEGRGEALSLGAALARTAGFTQLNPHLPLDTSKGAGYAVGVIDYGLEHSLLWVVALSASGEIWCVPNREVRMPANWSAGRRLHDTGIEAAGAPEEAGAGERRPIPQDALGGPQGLP